MSISYEYLTKEVITMLDVKMKYGRNYDGDGSTYLSRTSGNVKEALVWFNEYSDIDQEIETPQCMVATIPVNRVKTTYYGTKKELKIICINFHREEKVINFTHGGYDYYPVPDNLIRIFSDGKLVHQYSLGGDFHLTKEKFAKEVKGELSYLVTEK